MSNALLRFTLLIIGWRYLLHLIDRHVPDRLNCSIPRPTLLNPLPESRRLEQNPPFNLPLNLLDSHDKIGYPKYLNSRERLLLEQGPPRHVHTMSPNQAKDRQPAFAQASLGKVVIQGSPTHCSVQEKRMAHIHRPRHVRHVTMLQPISRVDVDRL